MRSWKPRLSSLYCRAAGLIPEGSFIYPENTRLDPSRTPEVEIAKQLTPDDWSYFCSPSFFCGFLTTTCWFYTRLALLVSLRKTRTPLISCKCAYTERSCFQFSCREGVPWVDVLEWSRSDRMSDADDSCEINVLQTAIRLAPVGCYRRELTALVVPGFGLFLQVVHREFIVRLLYLLLNPLRDQSEQRRPISP